MTMTQKNSDDQTDFMDVWLICSSTQVTGLFTTILIRSVDHDESPAATAACNDRVPGRTVRWSTVQVFYGARCAFRTSSTVCSRTQ